ncbi:SPOR domain-containing protein, partial [Rubrivivax gelatinosus]|uniref:SPOR domain-containing protein n=1 Tax=Rubrivivax gelatinosus TaxID=28068 RepID=UPI0005C23A99
ADAAPGFWLQLGAFRQAEGAATLRRQVLDAAGDLAVAVFDDVVAYRVQVGPYTTRAEAQRAAEESAERVAETEAAVRTPALAAADRAAARRTTPLGRRTPRLVRPGALRRCSVAQRRPPRNEMATDAGSITFIVPARASRGAGGAAAPLGNRTLPGR